VTCQSQRLALPQLIFGASGLAGGEALAPAPAPSSSSSSSDSGESNDGDVDIDGMLEAIMGEADVGPDGGEGDLSDGGLSDAAGSACSRDVDESGHDVEDVGPDAAPCDGAFEAAHFADEAPADVALALTEKLTAVHEASLCDVADMESRVDNANKTPHHQRETASGKAQCARAPRARSA
jgi:hypothetical protein